MSSPAISEAMLEARKPTPAQLKWLRHHARLGGTLQKWTGDVGSMTYVMAGNLSDAGWLTIQDGKHNRWPWSWESTSITDAGRAILETLGATQ